MSLLIVFLMNFVLLGFVESPAGVLDEGQAVNEIACFLKGTSPVAASQCHLRQGWRSIVKSKVKLFLPGERDIDIFGLSFHLIKNNKNFKGYMLLIDSTFEEEFRCHAFTAEALSEDMFFLVERLVEDFQKIRASQYLTLKNYRLAAVLLALYQFKSQQMTEEVEIKEIKGEFDMLDQIVYSQKKLFDSLLGV